MAGPLSGDTEMLAQDRPPLAPVSDGVARPQPCDLPGTRDSAGWAKVDAGNSSGWSRIDDVDGGMDAGWCQT